MVKAVLAALAQLVVAGRRAAALAIRILSADRPLVDFAAIGRQKVHERDGRMI
jgi:hypothetical protein